MALSVFGPTKAAALDLALAARERCFSLPLDAVPGYRMVPDDVIGPWDFPDERSSEQRFILTFTYFFYALGG